MNIFWYIIGIIALWLAIALFIYFIYRFIVKRGNKKYEPKDEQEYDVKHYKPLKKSN